MQTYDEDFCYDCRATSCEEVAPGVYKYGIGMAFEIERDKRLVESRAKISLDFRPRSSVWKTGMVLSNCTGTVDELYRGEVSAVFYHLIPSLPIYKVGDKIVQCKLGFTVPIEFEVVDELTETERGCNGYGSTGK